MKVITTALLFLAFLANLGEAQVRGYPMFNGGSLTKAELIRQVEGGCKAPLFEANCEELLSQYQAADPEGAPRKVADLAPYLRILTEKECPMKMILGRILKPGRHLRYDWERLAREGGERCLFNEETQSWVLSLDCGNAIVSPRVTNELPLPTVKEGEVVVVERVRPDTVWISSRDTVFTKVYGDSIVFDNRVTVREAGWMSLKNTDMYVSIIKGKKGSVLGKVASHLGALGVGMLIGSQINSCSVVNNGGPFNPPNSVGRDGLVGISFKLFRP